MIFIDHYTIKVRNINIKKKFDLLKAKIILHFENKNLYSRAMFQNK